MINHKHLNSKHAELTSRFHKSTTHRKAKKRYNQLKKFSSRWLDRETRLVNKLESQQRFRLAELYYHHGVNHKTLHSI